MPPRILLRPHPEERAISAFTRVHSPSKTGVNALMDALWRASRRMGAAGHPKNSRREFLGTPLMLRDAHHHGEVPALALRDALLRNAPQGEGGPRTTCAPQHEAGRERSFRMRAEPNSTKARWYVSWDALRRLQPPGADIRIAARR